MLEETPLVMMYDFDIKEEVDEVNDDTDPLEYLNHKDSSKDSGYHKRKLHPKEMGTYTCNHCDKIFTFKSNFRNHKKFHEKNPFR